MMPKQKPGKSRQNFRTPKVFIDAVKGFLGIEEFTFDFAADSLNTKALHFYNRQQNALKQEWAPHCQNGWGWLNPPFAKIEPWAEKCVQTMRAGGSVAFLVPASVGSNWFKEHVHQEAFVLALNGRIAFDPKHPTWGYPKDCMLCLFSLKWGASFEVWSWESDEG